MARRRSSFRVRAGLHGWVLDAAAAAAAAAADGRADRPGLAARSVDLSRSGAGLICAGWPEPDAPVRLTLEDAVDGHPVGRHWSGRVTHARRVADGVRVGVAFDWPVGPGARPAGSSALRLPGPAWDAFEGPARPAASAASAAALAAWAVPGVALAGFAADQLSKAWAASAGAGFDGLFELLPDLLAVAPAENTGALASLAGGSPLTAPLCAAAALVLSGLAVTRTGSSRGLAGAAGLGLLGAGLAGNSADRLALGYVRDFLVCGLLPRWSFNLADVFLVAGALALLAARPSVKVPPPPPAAPPLLKPA